MIEVLPHLPDRVLGIQARGEVTADDYQSVLMPAIDEKVSRYEQLRLLYVLGADFNGYTGRAAWEDAKLGMRYFMDFERIAIVTNVDWIERTVKTLGSLVPADVRVFSNEDIDEARTWICEDESIGELSVELLEDSGVLVLAPDGELDASDFDRVAAKIDPYIEKTGDLSGLVIVAEQFPGWHDFTAFTTHLRFLRSHNAKIHRVGVVTNSKVLANAPKLAGPFLEAEIRRFPPAHCNAAIAWVAGGSGSS